MSDLTVLSKLVGRFLTGIVLFAFISIILVTTFSEADWVQTFCKVMYWTIVTTAISSGILWLIQRTFPEMLKGVVEQEIVSTADTELENHNKSDMRDD
mgnify:CR=1 FL=1